jgi:hypothetical protein
MFDHSRLVRLITVALASCAMTWALAGTALARPDNVAPTAGQSSAPPFQAAQGDANKAPAATATQAPAFQAAAGDTDKTPNPRQVQGVLNGLDQSPQPSADTTDDTGTAALVIAIIAIMTAIGAVTLTITRTERPMMGA